MSKFLRSENSVQKNIYYLYNVGIQHMRLGVERVNRGRYRVWQCVGRANDAPTARERRLHDGGAERCKIQQLP
jgi:hypothetical protein